MNTDLCELDRPIGSSNPILRQWEITGMYGLRPWSRVVAFVFYRWFCGSAANGRAIFYV